MSSETKVVQNPSVETVSKVELNSWRRGFTPQAELWNGRMAMFALIFLLVSLIIINLSI